MLETIRVRRDSYPIRKSYLQFFKQYGFISTKAKKLVEQLVKEKADFKQLVMDLFQEHFPIIIDDLVLFGSTKIFIRVKANNYINQMYQKKIEKV